MPDVTDLLLLARLCNLAYVDSEPVRVKSADALGIIYLATYETVDHRAFLATQRDRTILVLCGTRFSDGNWRELFDDEDLLPASANPAVMAGFHRGCAEMFGWAREKAPQIDTVTGHSLGGARAHLSPLWLGPKEIVSFGAPKCGTATYWKNSATPLIRVVHEHDFAPAFPFISEFIQATPLLWLHDGKIVEAQEAEWFGDSLADHSIQDGYVKALEALTPAA
jgi:hypothetical protein